MPPLAGGQGICSDSTWLSSGRKTRVPISTPRPGSPPAPTTESEEKRSNQPCKTRKRNPFSPKIMKSKSILLFLGHSSFDSEATQFTRLPIIIIVKALSLAPASFTNFLTDRELKRLPGLSLGRGEQVARASSLLLPGAWLQGSRKISKSPRICAATEGSRPALNKPRQAQAEPASWSSLLRAPHGPGARDASLLPQVRGVDSLQTGRAPAAPPTEKEKGPGRARRGGWGRRQPSGAGRERRRRPGHVGAGGVVYALTEARGGRRRALLGDRARSAVERVPPGTGSRAFHRSRPAGLVLPW